MEPQSTVRLEGKFTFKWDLPGQDFPHDDCIAVKRKGRWVGGEVSNIGCALVNPLRGSGTLQQAEQAGGVRTEEEPGELISQLLKLGLFSQNDNTERVVRRCFFRRFSIWSQCG